MIHFIEIIKDTLVATLVGFCGKKVYHKVQNWYYNKKDLDINDIHIDFIPQATEDEMVIITRKGNQPEVFKYFSNIK